MKPDKIIHDIDEYQANALLTFKSRKGESRPERIARLALGVSDEAGEVAGAVKKYLRGDFGEVDTYGAVAELQDRVRAEAGDVLWYLALLLDQLHVDMSDVATQNIYKLLDRDERGKIKGDGDNR